MKTTNMEIIGKVGGWLTMNSSEPRNILFVGTQCQSLTSDAFTLYEENLLQPDTAHEGNDVESTTD